MGSKNSADALDEGGLPHMRRKRLPPLRHPAAAEIEANDQAVHDAEAAMQAEQKKKK